MYATTTRQSATPILYLRRVYAWLLAGIALSGLGGYAALNVGSPVHTTIDRHDVLVAPVVAMMSAHPILSGFLLIAMTFLTMAVRKAEGMNAVAFFMLTLFAGAFVAPLIVFAQAKAAAGTSLTSHPVRDAFMLTSAAFVGLTSYTMVTKRDFSYLRAGLVAGLWVLLVALIIGMLLGSSVYSLAVSSMAVLLFCGFIILDTSKVLRSSDRDDPVGDALNLYLDVLNIFVHLLSIFAGGSNRD
jgi:modulator of FtsH protease